MLRTAPIVRRANGRDTEGGGAVHNMTTADGVKQPPQGDARSESVPPIARQSSRGRSPRAV